LSPAEQVARFGAHPFPLYVYNVSMAGLSVLLSQPTTGRWTVGAALLEGRLDPVFVVEMGSSILTTGLILWYACGRGASGSRRWREPDVLVFAAIVVANACLTWAYVKNEIVSTAGVFYALAAGAAMRELLSRSRVTMSVPIALALFVLGSAWAIRDVGLHFKLRHSAFVARSEWAYVLSPAHREDWPADERTRAIVSRLKQEAVSIQGPPPALMPEWAEDWFGEE
jgi:hypothetical protein